MTVLSFAEPGHSRLRPEWQEVYVGESRVEVLALGEGEPLLFLHGWGLRPRAYLPALRSLADRGYRITAPSMPGFGQTDARRNQDHSLSGVADHMIDALDALALPEGLPVSGPLVRRRSLPPDALPPTSSAG